LQGLHVSLVSERFSGIGAREQAMPHWQWLWHAEIEKFPNAVMAARHPNSINLGDVNAPDFIERAEAAGRPDVIVFGSPCQSFSVAGRRLGLDDPRGNLALIALGIIARLKPSGFIFENVPGLLSSDGGRDWGIFLRTVDDIGYRGAWAVLDALERNCGPSRIHFPEGLGRKPLGGAATC
jgi:DNA (cytosine-5)-methyltransferase 1